jgi:hypothetical protein
MMLKTLQYMYTTFIAGVVVLVGISVFIAGCTPNTMPKSDTPKISSGHDLMDAAIACRNHIQYLEFDNVYGNTYTVYIDPTTDKPFHC